MDAFEIIHDDCINALEELIKQGVQVDSIITDPPYELGFMGKVWDKSGISYNQVLWELCLQILKPGGHLLSFGGARTYHRMACAIEDAGFEIRDQIMWIYGSGFPKSLDISKAIDKAAGAERKIGGYRAQFPDGTRGASYAGMKKRGVTEQYKLSSYQETIDGMVPFTIPATEDAKKWQGWGTALKPAHEPIVLARKPLSEATIAANVLKYGTGAINIDGCRIAGDIPTTFPKSRTPNEGYIYQAGFHSNEIETAVASTLGRFPANLIHDGSEEIEAEFAKYGERKSGHSKPRKGKKHGNVYGRYNQGNDKEFLSSTGKASRFFYCAKASTKERNGSQHPTIKPLALIRYLCRLITPRDGIILDPFAGTGTTGLAAIQEGFRTILIEKEADYISDIKKRIENYSQLELNTN